MEHSQKIKSVTTPRFEIILIQLSSGQYCVGYERPSDEKPTLSEPITDLGMAMHMFEIKLRELEGN